jgi:aminoglycoside N3'-acetyltransferase
LTKGGSLEKLVANSGILYVRASLRALAPQIHQTQNVVDFLKAKIEFDEIFAPHFYGARLLWRKRINPYVKKTNSGALGKSLLNLTGSTLSGHPTHSFVGIGPKVGTTLSEHNETSACFYPIWKLSESDDYSMLLIGCVDESPGFSTVHATQERLGLARRHLERLLLRWDYIDGDKVVSKIAPESPGCSESFDKFYDLYIKDGNFQRGNWDGVNWIYIQSARRAMKVEAEILSINPRFVKCKKIFCWTCTLRVYFKI